MEPQPKQQSAAPFSPSIAIDDRELRSRTARRLYELGAKLDSKRLYVGDYVLSSRCCIERKNSDDLESSIIDGRLFSQAVDLCEAYSSPIIAIVGSEFSRLDPKAVRGALSSLAVDFRIPSFTFSSEEELAEFLFALAAREQAANRGPPRIQTSRKEISKEDMQRLVVESLPSVGPIHAKALLEKFGSVKAVFSASEKELMGVEGIGEMRAKKIRQLIDSGYP